MAVRIKDIARDLGLAPITVSKALRNHNDISVETRSRVAKRAAELNYRMDWVARSLVTGRTFLVGLVVPDLMQSFFAEIATAVARAVLSAGYHVVISHTDENDREEASHIDVLVGRKVDGLIIASAKRSDDGGLLGNLRTPFVLVDRLVPGVEANYVGMKNEEIGFVATEHLIHQGCRKIAHICGPDLSVGAGRLRGYRRALAQYGVPAPPELVAQGGVGDAAGYGAMRRLLQLDPRPDGIFCFNDPVAIGALRAMLEAGLSIPRDAAIIGAANMHYSDVLGVPLSTIDQSSSETGERAAELLLACMTSRQPVPPRQVFLPPRLIVRKSTQGFGQ